MGQKDLTQKNPEYYPDVSADTINALLYEERQVVKPEELQPAPTETIYPGKAGGLWNQFHDVNKYENRDGLFDGRKGVSAYRSGDYTFAGVLAATEGNIG